LPQVSWLLTVVACLIAALLVLINGYVGYFGVLLAVAASAAVNLR
jgi:ABC-type Fe3+-siderophore transport system permease subunit